MAVPVDSIPIKVHSRTAPNMTKTTDTGNYQQTRLFGGDLIEIS